jgi:hypothetical protein
MSTPRHGNVHSLVRSPGGRLLDARGWTTEADLAKRYRIGKPCLSDVPPGMAMAAYTMEEEVDGIRQEKARVASALRALPGSPFQDEPFKALLDQPIEGVDFPCFYDEETTPAP